MKHSLHVGSHPLHFNCSPVHGDKVTLEGEDFYRIANYDQLRPFFISVVSSANHWTFISSNGALTAGRTNPDQALFPYYTDDKIHDSAAITGSKTLLIVRRKKQNQLWEPFSNQYRGVYRIHRNLYKNIPGNKLIFEEINEDLNLTFRYGWCNSDRFGLVRKATLTCTGRNPVRVQLLDGIQNLMPCGVGSQFQLEKSTLIDAYKKNELLPETGLGLFTLSSVPVDRPEPAESLKANTVWSLGLEGSSKLISSVQLERFAQGLPVHQETDVRAERGAYFIRADLTLRPHQQREWWIAGDVNRGPSDVTELNRLLREPKKLQRLLEEDIQRGTRELEQIVASSDGLQKSAQPLGNARHFNNVLFNVMRGGVFQNGYQVDVDDLRAFVRHANQDVASRHQLFFQQLGKSIHYTSMVALAAETGDANLERLCREYLPLTFSRRHGDPSRPWNRFSIPARGADGNRMVNYEGNWRDIFQNWEALALSFPGYTAGIICKFVNASTADGYNPYRISRDGIDWEVTDPDDPWSHIGYWGDHQIIYLLKLLELLQQHDPLTLRDLLTREIFSYANVPYRIEPYEDLLANPKDTVVFDPAAEKLVRSRVQSRGSDGKLVWDDQEQVRLVNLTEKLLVPILAKLSNFIPEAGIWLNTQRPEWNDANNALVGYGVSMVTLYYLRRHLAFCAEIFRPLEHSEISLSAEVDKLLQVIARTLERHQDLLSKSIGDQQRRRILDELGRAGSEYREQIYSTGFSGQRSKLKFARLLKFLDLALDWVDHSIRANQRPDRLYHAYNLISLERKNEVPIRRLYEMLEGQVAALSSGKLSAAESLRVLVALKKSAMYRADQHSYLLYPNRQLPRFTEKNNLPRKEIARSRLLQQLIRDGNRQLVEQDGANQFHFNGSLTNASDVARVLEQLANGGYRALVAKESKLIQEIFERHFDHQSFTGRSGTFFGYEGLGSIYWHMVSKLLLAAQEGYFRATEQGAPRALLQKLATAYYDIRAGIGDYKSPEVYGAFPMDPYSHTPAHTGARQPGLTGQVKEDILCRLGELGLFVRDGQIHFEPRLLRREEFLTSPTQFRCYDAARVEQCLDLPKDSLAFTYCQVPIIYQRAQNNALAVFLTNGNTLHREKLQLDAEISRAIFDRTGQVQKICVWLRVS